MGLSSSGKTAEWHSANHSSILCSSTTPKVLLCCYDKITMEPCRFSNDVSLGVAINSLLQAKHRSNCRSRYINSLRIYLYAFMRGRESALISSVDILSIEQWFAARGEASSTMASNIGRLSALFSYAERRGWINRNPCKMLEKPKLDRKTPRILSVEESERLINFTVAEKPHAVPYLVLAMLGGIRPEEIERIGTCALRIDQSIVVIDAEASKVRQRRIVNLHPKAVGLLKQCPSVRLPFSKESRRRYLSQACKCLGFPKWPQDCLRHTAASYLLASTKDVAKVAMQLGNSPSILLRHYMAIVTPEEAARFWA